ncbi:MAG: efflux RND transporter periplasmic adaptor subunit, partial [Anaerolineales bacterium]|nr:efflux RND transporter periplasmic adaptor subunit [Anaerolineales bacterium]
DLAASEAAVASAQAQLDDLLDGPNDTDIAAAEANVRAANGDIAAAYARFDANRAAPTAAEIQAAELELQLAQQAATSAAEQHTRILVTEPNKYLAEDDLADIEYSARVQAVQANADLAAAQQKYDDLINGDANTISGSQANLAAATASRDAAQAQLDQLLAGPSEAETASAEANLAQAKANLDRLRRGPSQAQITLSEAQVEQARISLQRTQNNLENAILRAPFDGTITAVNVSPGEQANGILVELVNNDSLEVVLDVDEVDLGEMSIGQPAVVTLESWPDVEIDGAIITIAPKANQDNSALVTYAVNLSLDATDLPILVGMTANADLITSNREGVLLVPNAAINADRTAGTYSVNLVEIDADGNETTTEIPVTIGLRDNQFTQITSGLQAGDRVMVGNIVPLRNPFGPDSDGGNGDNGPGGNNNDGGPFGG